MPDGSAVLIHGGWGVPEDWRWVREPIEAGGLEVVAVGLPSHRDARPGLAEDAAAVRDAVRGARQPVVGVGWSYGTWVLAEAATTGVPFAHLVFVSGVPGPETEADYADLSWIDAHPHIETLPDGRYRLDSDWFLDEELGRTLPDEVRAQARRTGRRWSNRNTERPISHDDWAAFPATVLYGVDDPLLSEREKHENAARFDDVRIVPGDHFVIWRTPELVAEAVLDALR